MSETPEKQRLTDRKRAAILAAAVSEFQKHGFDGTSMDRVAEAAGASKRTVYNHFKSKDALFAAIIDDVRSKVGEIGVVPYDPDGELEPQLVRIGTEIAAVTMGEEFISLARAVISRFIQAPEFAAATMEEQDTFNEVLEAWIRAAAKDGRLAVADAGYAATEFTGLIKAFAFWPQLIGSSPPLTERDLNAVIRSSAAMFLCRYGDV